ncbi:MAG TPA: hypothetical protein VIK13_17515, partial [Candidatus Limnocylindrales bacterium]
MIRSVAPVLLALSTLLAGCASAATTTIAPADSPIVEASPAATFPSVPTFSPAPSPSQLAPPVSLPLGPPAFTTPVPPDAATAWKSISWRKLKADDPLAQVRSVVRWRGGFVALGAEIATGEGSRTPVWVSPDGATWRPLDTDVLGPATIVIGIGETAGGIVALTLQGGRNQCGTQTSPLNCRTPAAPLQSWTSSDATDWTAHRGPPGIALEAVGCEGCGVDVPIFRSGIPGLVAVNSGATQPTSSRAAFSRDGIAWESLPADAFPAGFQFGDVAGFRSGFVAVGEQNVTV